MHRITIVGAGLAGCEAAWQLARRGIAVTLCEMKPHKRSPAHHSDAFAELVCSNSLRGARLENAVGLLKEELRRCGSLILEAADNTRVPAGGALAVDRNAFSAYITNSIQSHPNITVIHGEVTELPPSPVIIATGPLTSDKLADKLFEMLNGTNFANEENEAVRRALHFFDAAAPLIAADSIDMEYAYWGARYGRGDADYINCPMQKDEYLAFREALASAKQAELHGFEDDRVFEGCLPVEVMARRGEDTLRYGPLRPVGLRDPSTDKGAYAVLQLRRDNAAGTIFNMVGFQTHLLFAEQRRVFSMFPALKNAEFLRYGVMHRNTYVDSPRNLDEYFKVINHDNIWLAGQLTGVEGYVESTASGLMTALAASAALHGDEPVSFPQETALGALSKYISNPAVTDFQPMNISFGLIPPLADAPRDKQTRYRLISERSLAILEGMLPRIKERIV